MTGEAFATLPLALYRHSLAFWRRQLQRQERFLDLTALREQPEAEWSTPSDAALDLPSVTLRAFSHPQDRARDGGGIPTLIVTPQVNSSYICDYGPEQSLVRVLNEQGLGPVFATDWRSADPGRADETLDDSLAALARCVSYLGGRARLVGLCQGGWMSMIHAALRPNEVASLVLAAAPVDFHADPGAVNHMARNLPMSFYRGLVAMGGGTMRGELISAGFNNLLPYERYFAKYVDLWVNIEDDDYVERFRRLDNWYSLHQHIPGATYLRIVKELFKENRLVRGTMECCGSRVELRNVTAPLYLVGGERDHITRPGQLFAAERHVSSEVARRYVADAGHIGVFMGSGPLRDLWPRVAADIIADSGGTDVD